MPGGYVISLKFFGKKSPADRTPFFIGSASQEPEPGGPFSVGLGQKPQYANPLGKDLTTGNQDKDDRGIHRCKHIGSSVHICWWTNGLSYCPTDWGPACGEEWSFWWWSVPLLQCLYSKNTSLHPCWVPGNGHFTLALLPTPPCERCNRFITFWDRNSPQIASIWSYFGIKTVG